MGSNWPRYVEFVLWVTVVSAIVTLVTAPIGFLIGNSLIGVKYALFVVGVLLFGLGSFGIQPTPPHEDSKRISLDMLGETRLEAFVQTLPPIRDHPVPYDQRVDRGTKLFVTSLVVLGISLIMEFVLGIRV